MLLEAELFAMHLIYQSKSIRTIAIKDGAWFESLFIKVKASLI